MTPPRPIAWKPAALLLVVLAFSGVATASHGGGIGDVPFSDLLEGRLGVDASSDLSNLSGTEKLLFGIVIPFLLVFILFFELLDKIEVLSRQSSIAVSILLAVSLLATPTYPRIATFFLGTVLPLMTQSMLGIAAVGIILFLVMLGLSGRGGEGAGGLLSGNKQLIIWLGLGVGAFFLYGGIQNVLLVISVLIMAVIAIVGFYVLVGEKGGGPLGGEMGVEEAIIFTVIMVGLMLYTFFEVPFLNDEHKGGALGMVLVIILILIIAAAIIEAKGEKSFLGKLIG